ncbi:bacteriocin [Streptococcus orisasini]
MNTVITLDSMAFDHFEAADTDYLANIKGEGLLLGALGAVCYGIGEGIAGGIGGAGVGFMVGGPGGGLAGAELGFYGGAIKGAYDGFMKGFGYDTYGIWI